jgi:hypothetical protein
MLPIHHYYMVLAFPFVFVWFARLVLAGGRNSPRAVLVGRALLLLLCLTHLGITVGHLGYIHDHRSRRLGGEYGIPYAAQVRAAGVSPGH